MTDSGTIDHLRRAGLTRVPGLTRVQADEVASHLETQPCYEGHVRVYGDGVARSFEAATLSCPVWCHDLSAAVTAPHLWELALAQVPLARAYLGAAPRLYSLHAFWSRPYDGPPMRDLQTWHRDHDDERFLVLFAYGTDVVTDADGPHQFQYATHREGVIAGPAESVLGPAGTAFLADTSGLHLGVLPQRGRRLLLWARWGISERPWAYGQDQTQPIDRALLGGRYPSDPELQELVKLIVT